jgi:hypothetical protein
LAVNIFNSLSHKIKPNKQTSRWSQ